MSKILFNGGGGHFHSVIDSLCDHDYDEIALIDVISKIGNNILGFSVIGSDEDLERLHAEGYTHGFISIAGVDKIRLFGRLKEVGFTIPNIIDQTAVISKNTEFGVGIFVGKKAVVNNGAKIGSCSIINTGVIIEHDCEIADFCHIAPGVVLCGNVKIGRNTHIGAGTVIRQGITIGENTMIGAGSVVVKDIGSGVTAYGNPCRIKS